MPGVTGKEVLQHVQRNHPEMEVVIITGVEDVELAVESMKMGAYDYLCKPVDDSRLLTTLDRALERSRLRGEIDKLRDRISLEGLRHKEAFREILTQDRKFLRSLRKVEQIAESDNNVLIWGESGTGKELVARAIHRIGRRRDKPFVAVNSGTFASELFSSEFFGHDKGAFTGAAQAKAGFIEEADGGVLFLDEIGELELPVQSKLLRVLQSGDYFRLGSTLERGADVRIIASTNKDLEAEIEHGRFRRDLYYRLNISSIYVSPLRERKGDVELLAHHFLEMHGKLNDKAIAGISDDVMSLLAAYDYPGNVRELENIIASAVVLENGRTLGRGSLPAYLVKAVTRAGPSVPRDVRKTLDELEAEHIRIVLEHTGGNRTAAAAILGISRVGLLAKMRKFGIAVEPPGRGGGRRPNRVEPPGRNRREDRSGDPSDRPATYTIFRPCATAGPLPPEVGRRDGRASPTGHAATDRPPGDARTRYAAGFLYRGAGKNSPGSRILPSAGAAPSPICETSSGLRSTTTTPATWISSAWRRPSRVARTKVLVAVADVDALVKKGSAIDAHAAAEHHFGLYRRRDLSDASREAVDRDLTSLGFQEERPAIVIEMLIGEEGVAPGVEDLRGPVRNRAKLAYNSVAAWLEGKGPMPGAGRGGGRTRREPEGRRTSRRRS